MVYTEEDNTTQDAKMQSDIRSKREVIRLLTKLQHVIKNKENMREGQHWNPSTANINEGMYFKPLYDFATQWIQKLERDSGIERSIESEDFKQKVQT